MPNVVFVLLALSVIVALAPLGVRLDGLDISIPVPCLAISVLLSLLVGVFAAVLPFAASREAERLTALSYE